MKVKTGAGKNFNAKSFHSTRHTCNSLLANAGVPMDIRRAITGHADDVTNMIYTHFSDEKKQEALASAFKF
jgi:integrase